MKKALFITVVVMLAQLIVAQKKIVVDANGGGDYKTIQEAINGMIISAGTTVTIFIKQGVYKEKLFIEKSNIVLEGEDKENTIITAAIARDEWRCEHRDDWVVATINVRAN